MFMFAYNQKKTRTGTVYVIMKIIPLIVSPYYNFLMTWISKYRGRILVYWNLKSFVIARIFNSLYNSNLKIGITGTQNMIIIRLSQKGQKRLTWLLDPYR